MNQAGQNDGGESHAELRWIQAATMSDLKSNGALEVVLEGHIVAIFDDDGTIRALDGLCAHQGGPIANGQLAKTHEGHACVTCPWHGWQYELETGIQTVNRQPLQRVFPVRVENDLILLGL